MQFSNAETGMPKENSKLLLFDRDGNAYQPVRNFNRTTGISAFRVQRSGTSNRAEDAEEMQSVSQVAKALLIDGRLARIKAISGGPVNYLGYGKQKLVSYQLDPDIAERLGIPATGSSNGPHDGSLLDRFRKNPDFANAEARWSADQRDAFIRIAQDVHAAGLDWWFVDIAHSPVRFGRKDKGAAKARAVIGYLRAADGRLDISTRQNTVPDLAAGDGFTLKGPGLPDLCAKLLAATETIADTLPTNPPREGLWPDELTMEAENEPAMPSPTNLILYGPPGTGKTYATAREAVRLCGEAVPEDREALMALYRSLHHKGRIGFVTFHQNFAYEDFVEGLRPVTGGASEGAASGFTLEAQDGIFKQMAEIAASNHGRAVTAPPALDRSGKVFKMSLGRSWASEDDVIYQDAIRDGYVTLGWGGDIDWSDPRYDDWDAIKLRWRQDHPDASGNDPNMSQMYTFRINMEIGSLVVISDGNRKFRAIGQIAGPYEYRPGHNGEYNHYRRVRWLWHGESLPRERIYDKELSQVSAYQMNGRNLNWDGIEQTVASGGDAVATSGEPEPHVLIIDEINRANISKVFGELITLLEPDKRLGMPNALTVRLPYSKTEFGVPANLHIIGTMNTADRSIALLDTALRRRFSFREMAPEPQLLAAAGGIDLRRVLTTINERIEYLVDREHRIGHAFFIHCRSRDDVNAVMRDKVIPLLQEYFFDDWSRIAAVVGPGFIKRTELKAPPGFGDLPPRPKWAVRADFAANAYDDLVGGKEVTAIDTEGEDEREDAPA